MASTTSFLQPFDPFLKTRSKKVKPSWSWSRNTNSLKVGAMKREGRRNQNWRGRVVDENMIVLRKRIHQMKMMEADSELPREWMDWEKRVYESYDAIICDAMGHLQSYLMETRPSLSLGVFVLIALSVPTSTAVVMHNFVGFCNAVFSGIN